jgi:two-component system alkaline phosphatase synthesis response regulator PhoP
MKGPNTNKILLVDDDPDILEFLGYNLENEGFRIYKSMNGADALETAARIKPHLIILDIMMPEMNGIETCRKLRSIPQLKSTIIVFLTVLNEDYLLITGFEAGGDDFITKPVKPKVLIARIRALLKRYESNEEKKTSKSGLLKFENMIIDPEKCLLIMSGKEFALPRKEFKLLMLLTSKPSKLFTRLEIFHYLWGDENTNVSERTIDVYIRKLRERIGQNRISTVKGLGYKFLA